MAAFPAMSETVATLSQGQNIMFIISFNSLSANAFWS